MKETDRTCCSVVSCEAGKRAGETAKRRNVDVLGELNLAPPEGASSALLDLARGH